MSSQPCLPQNDPSLATRVAETTATQNQYSYTQAYLRPLPMLKDVPSREAFSARYVAERIFSLADLGPNFLAAKARSLVDPLDHLQDYEDLFQLLPLPDVARTYKADWVFAEQRLAGANPFTLQRLDAVPPAFPFTDAHVSAGLGSALTLAQAAAAGLLYVADYRKLAGIQAGRFDGAKKYCPAPIALFGWKEQTFSMGGSTIYGQLVPLAIQVMPGAAKIATPGDNPDDWLYAKICVQIADANHHEMSSHLCRTHFVMAPFGITTERQLAANHPIGVLLRPHMRFMLYNNDLGRRFLINEGGPVDRLLAGSIGESLKLVQESYSSWSLDTANLKKEAASRGVDNGQTLPHYPYRDDGLLVWDAIEAYVTKYVDLYYTSAADLANDSEIQAWAHELAAPAAGAVKGMPATITSNAQLVEILTTVIYTCSAVHSAVNYPQWDFMAFAPNMPLAGYAPIAYPPIADDTVDPLLQLLPPWGQASDQLSIMDKLTSYRFDRLGHFEEPFTDPRAARVLESFQAELGRVGAKIDARNRYRPMEYRALLPAKVLNSISI